MSTGQYMNHQSFTISKTVEKIFPQHKNRTKGYYSWKIAFVSIGITRVVLLSSNFLLYTSYEKVAQSSANIPVFLWSCKTAWKRFWCSCTNFWENCNSLLKNKYIVPAAKRVRANLIKIAAPEIGEVFSGRKRLKPVCKICCNKDSSKKTGRWEKRNPSVEQEEKISRKSSSKICRSRKHICDKNEYKSK